MREYRTCVTLPGALPGILPASPPPALPFLFSDPIYNKTENIEILSLGRNCIKKFQFLEDISGTLKQLWVSYNSIDKLDNLHTLKKLQVLYLFHNKIKNLEEVDKLSALPELVELGLKGNPIYDGKTNEYMKLVILKKLPQLKVVDNETVHMHGAKNVPKKEKDKKEK